MPIRVKAFAISRDDRGRIGEWAPPEISDAAHAQDRANILGPYASTGAELKGPSVISYTVDTRSVRAPWFPCMCPLSKWREGLGQPHLSPLASRIHHRCCTLQGTQLHTHACEPGVYGRPSNVQDAQREEAAAAEGLPEAAPLRRVLHEGHSIVPRADDPDMIVASSSGPDPDTGTVVVHFSFKGLEFAHPTRMVRHLARLPSTRQDCGRIAASPHVMQLCVANATSVIRHSPSPHAC